MGKKRLRAAYVCGKDGLFVKALSLCAPERVVHGGWLRSVNVLGGGFDAEDLCLTSTLPGPQSLGFLLLGPPEMLVPKATGEDITARIVIASSLDLLKQQSFVRCCRPPPQSQLGTIPVTNTCPCTSDSERVNRLYFL
ncbi:hypothetical protein TNCV_227571 [Trichonephila clavipes]|nr:hypothetical protein TNCV_227571 [Trichonephila clavipes]